MVIKDNNYILGIAKPYSEEEIEIHEICKNAPIAPNGYIYKLKIDKTWKLCKKPISKEQPNEEYNKILEEQEQGVDYGV